MTKTILCDHPWLKRPDETIVFPCLACRWEKEEDAERKNIITLEVLETLLKTKILRFTLTADDKRRVFRILRDASARGEEITWEEVEARVRSAAERLEVSAV